jgi:hypothetical protein
MKVDDELDEALELLCSPAADDFARALDRCGWMIVGKPELVAQDEARGVRPRRWSIFRGECPSWAEPWDGSPAKSAKIIPFPKPE